MSIKENNSLEIKKEEYNLEYISQEYGKSLQDVNYLFLEFDSIVKD